MKLFRIILIFCGLSFSTQSLTQNFEVFVSDAGGFNNPPWQVVEFDESGNTCNVFENDKAAWPQDVLFMEADSVVLISQLQSQRITKHHAETGDYLSDFAIVSGGPTRMKIGPDGLLYVLQWSGNGKVLRYQLDGTFVDEFTTIGLITSIGLDWDSEGNLYVSSYGQSQSSTPAYVNKFDPDGNDLGPFVPAGQLAGPTNIWFQKNELFVLDYNGNAVKKFNMNGQSTGTFISNLSNPEGIAFLPNGNMLIGNSGDGTVREYNASGTFIKNFTIGGCNLKAPNAVVIRILDQSTTVLPTILEVQNLVESRIGNTFHLNTTLMPDFEFVKIFNADGIEVDSIIRGQGNIWDATALPSGLYVIQIGNMNKQRSQKVILK